jgi:hypothetical protein
LHGQDFHVNFQQQLSKVDVDVSTLETASDGNSMYSNSLSQKTSFYSFLSLDIPEKFHLEKWPCLHDSGRAAIQEMINMHFVILILAYDTNLRLIILAQYPYTLKNTVAIIYFLLSHQLLGH